MRLAIDIYRVWFPCRSFDEGATFPTVVTDAVMGNLRTDSAAPNDCLA